MNAFEALEKIQEMIELNAELAEECKLLGYEITEKQARHALEALTIVSESAKQFHIYYLPEIIKGAQSAEGFDIKRWGALNGVSLRRLGIELNDYEQVQE